ncbi:MAG: hypothetical protein D6805_06590 [Planctomycetota bacterium]|nr:MAG: hypothetical protein D6805_06590 [Planctomycetota bacterium]
MSSNLPPNYYQTIFSQVPWQEWRNFLQQHSRYAPKGFRPQKAPKKVIELTLLKQLKEDEKFLQLALEFWQSKQELELHIYSTEFIQNNLEYLCLYKNKETIYWLCYLDKRKEVQELCKKILDLELPSPSPSSALLQLHQQRHKLNQIRQEQTQLQQLQKAIEEQEKKNLKTQSSLQQQLKQHQTLVQKLQKENQQLLQQLQQYKQKVSSLQKDLQQQAQNMPPDFTPCSLVLQLEKRLQNLDKQLAEKEKLHYQIRKLEEKLQHYAQKEAQHIQNLRQQKEKNLQLQEKLSKKNPLSSQPKPQKPLRTSSKTPPLKIIWPSEPHHYPKRLKSFLDKLARNPYIDSISIIEFENSPKTRLKSLDEQGNIYLLYSDGEKAAKCHLRTTANNLQEGLYIEEQILQIDPTIQERNK